MDDFTLETRTSTGNTVPTGWCPSVYWCEGTPWRCAFEYLAHRGDHIANVGPDEEITWTDALAEPTGQDLALEQTSTHHQPNRRNPA